MGGGGGWIELLLCFCNISLSYQVAELGGTLGLFFGFSFLGLWDETIFLAALTKKLHTRK